MSFKAEKQMRIHWATGTLVAIGAAVCTLTGAWASEPNNGRWAMQPSERPGMVQFTLQSPRGAHGFTSITDWPVKDFAGLDLAQDAQFTLTRDAGKFEFEGTLRDSAGAGSFKFFPDARYSQEMKALGFNVAANNQIHFGVHDVSLSFARDMKGADLQGLDADKLLAFRIHGVSRKFIDDLRAAGLNERDSDQLVAFRIHGVTPELVQRVRSAGYTPESQQLIAFRIHGVTPDFIGELQKLGFERPRPEELVSMRIHGVTPEYITELRGRGVKNLTIDKLVAMKIHGID